jgi:hypothetical protein
MSRAGPIEAGISALELTSADPASSMVLFLHVASCACRLLSVKGAGHQAETRGDHRGITYSMSECFESGLSLSAFNYTLWE